MNSFSKCLNPNCSRGSHVRGLCQSCYSAVLSAVRKGRVSMEALLEKGKILPRHGRETMTMITDWILDSPPKDRPVIRSSTDKAVERLNELRNGSTDWSMSDSDLARIHNVPRSDVKRMRQELGKPLHVSKLRRMDYSKFDGVDWQNTRDQDLATEFGVTRERIRQIRQLLGVPKRIKNNERREQLADWIKAHAEELKGRKRREVLEMLPGFLHVSIKNAVLNQSGIELDRSRGRTDRLAYRNEINWELPNRVIALVWGERTCNVANERCRNLSDKGPRWDTRFGLKRRPWIATDQQFLQAVEAEIAKAVSHGVENSVEVWSYIFPE